MGPRRPTGGLVRPADAYEALGLGDQVAPTAVKERWRALASEHHPDKGGDAEVFMQLRQAYQVALHHAAGPHVCPDCEGTGRRLKTHGWSQVTLRCAVCGGSGEVYREGAGPQGDSDEADE